MNKKIVICAGLMLLTFIPLCSVNGLNGWADNEYKPGGGSYSTCDDCENETWPNDTYTRFVVSGEDENGNKKTVELIACNKAQSALLGDQCDIVDDRLQNPLNGDMTTNDGYHISINGYLEETINNGEFTDTAIANSIAQVYCGSDTMTTECNEKLKQTIAERRANGEADPFDVNGYPGAVLNKDPNQKKDAYKDDLCAFNTPGTNNVLCTNLNNSCVAGSDTSYAGANQSSGTVSKGTVGICTYDTTNKLDAITTCSDYCQKNSNLKNCNSCCKEKDGKPYYDSSAPGCNDDTPKPETPDDEDDECPVITICDISPSSCVGQDDVLPSPDISGGSCNSDYTSDTYEFTGSFADSCNYVPIIKHTIVNINYPSSINKVIYAGQGFDWYGGFSGTATETLYAGNTSKLNAAINVQVSARQKLEAQMNCEIKKAIQKAKDEYDDCLDDCPDCSEEDTISPKDHCLEQCVGNKDCEEKCKDLSSESEYDTCSSSRTTCLNGCKKPNEADIRKKIEDSYKARFDNIDNEIKKLQDCLGQASSYGTRTSTHNAATTNSNMMKLDDGYTQKSNSAKYINKNNGLPLTTSSSEAFRNQYNFFVPSNIKDGTKGSLIATGYSSYVGSLSASCPMKVSNYLIRKGINVIYRPISLTNPFPDTVYNEEYRKRLSFWSENSPDIFIKNNRDTNDYNVYNLTPMYDITITPSDIKKIRQYNKKTSFNDFNLECENGLYCKSNFLRNSEFSYIVNVGNSCAMDSNWYACDTEKMGNTRDLMLQDLKK